MNKLLFPSLLLAGAACAATVQVDFGLSTQATATVGWNNLSSATAGADPSPASLANLVDSSGATTGIGIAYSESGGGQSGVAGTGANYDGSYPATVAGLPASALRDGYYLQNGNSITLTLTGLDPALSYDFLLYGARGNNGTRTVYTVSGTGGGSAEIGSVLNNSTEVAQVNGVAPTAGGIITVVVSAPTASSTSGGAVNMLSFTAVPEPSLPALLGLAGIGLLVRRRS